ncbi:carboxymuconolactone decarboxylase family protein [Lactiplantibacillus paraplantarum]|uniref:4-carboxymuconolactone decarboxylase n=1 Tax=Lactiplantibacillus paraplantarum TaxID=60520 RepID=A0A098R599_9LACO|nr:carboxymuconolactone decarboxylase family protein [Lactiplantibacillus paraplantarum]AVW10506.1 carboxymuconolactone decarboxylase family protein [Lactiplantibacillus paraplantarum]AYJ38749.1 carboxymuconolactone decarboxylase family protein [Lactiplantibacillus paraplantarum]ERL44810.1 putative 4-carboxymuconolactone decarboxylase [Lactiplantibacillus paraplantarum]KGE75270.1 hypothetical protein HR47_08320 [Lactiplantibacillus paraplantarum]KRL51485.1 hypothetical protein FD48_GL000170 [L
MTESKRASNGDKIFKTLNPEAAAQLKASLANTAPVLSQYISEFVFNDIFGQPGMSLKQKEIITLTVLLTLGDTNYQLRVHLQSALNIGITKAEIMATFVQCLPYAGFPRVLTAVQIATDVFAHSSAK